MVITGASGNSSSRKPLINDRRDDQCLPGVETLARYNDERAEGIKTIKNPVQLDPVNT